MPAGEPVANEVPFVEFPDNLLVFRDLKDLRIPFAGKLCGLRA